MTKFEDNPSPYLTLVEGSTPSDPASGDQRLFIDTADGLLKLVDETGTVTEVGGGGGGGGSFTAFTSYTPTLTAATTNPTLGTTGKVQDGRYCQTGSGTGSMVSGRFAIQFGSGMSAGSGAYKIALPVTAAVPSAGATFAVIGSGFIYSGAGGGIICCTLLLVDSTHAQIWRTAGAPGQTIGSSIPATWANGDSMAFEFGYEAA